MSKKGKRANGEGAIYKDNKRGKYVGQITIGADEHGKRKRKTVYGNTKAEVREKLNNVRYQIHTGSFTDKNDITIYHLAKQIFNDELNMNEIKENSYFRKLETLKRLKGIYNTPLQKVNETMIKDFLLSEQNYSQSTINKEFTMLKRVLLEAVKRNIIVNNPMSDMHRPKSKQEKIDVRALTVDEQRRLLKVLATENIKYSNQILLSLYTGMRMGEVNALSAEDINKHFKVINVHRTISRGQKGEGIINETTKTKAGKRNIPITNNIRELIDICLQKNKKGLLFKTDRGKVITTNQVNEVFKRVLCKYDILDPMINGKVSLHSLRHSYATRCIEAGMQPKVLQTLLGHTDISITLNTYCNAFDNLRDKNIETVNTYLLDIGLCM